MQGRLFVFHLTKRAGGGKSPRLKMTHVVSFACLFALVAAARGDEPATDPATTIETTPVGSSPSDFKGDVKYPAPSPSGLGNGGGLDGFGFDRGDIGGGAMIIPDRGVPGGKWVAGKAIVTFSDDGKQVLAYSEQHPRWVAQDLDQVAGAKPLPVVGGGDTVAVRVGHLFYAYSASLGKWDVLRLPPDDVAVPVVSDDGLEVHSASQGDYVFKDSWAKWFSADEIKAGRVAEYLLAQRSEAPADPAENKATHEVTVFYLKFVGAREAARIVRQLFDGKVNPAVEERTNALLIASDDPLAVKKVEELLKAIDSPVAKDLAIDFRSHIGVEDQKADELRRQLSELEKRTRELAAQLRGPLPDSATGDRLNDELRDTVKRAFEARQKLQRVELAEFAQRLRGIQQSIEMRDRISQKIIDRRVEELLHPNATWDGPAIVSENQVPAVRDDDHATHGNLPMYAPPADQSSSRYPQGKPLKASVQIVFDREQLGKIDWLAGPGSLTVDGFGKGRIVTPIGSNTSLRLTDLPGRDNAAMFVTLQIVDNPSSDLSRRGVLNPVELLAHNPIPLQVTDEDCDRVLSGEFVIKWIYLPHDLSTAGESVFNTLDSSRSEPTSISISEVEKLGVVVAILRLSNRPEPLVPGEQPPEPSDVVPPTSRPHDSSPRHGVRTLPDELVCWELFGAKFRKVIEELAGVPYHDSGLQIVELRPNGPAATAGLRVNDIVVIIDIRSVGEISHVKYALQAWQDSGGERARQVTFVRGNKTRRAFVNWLETPTISPPVRERPSSETGTQSDLDYQRELMLEIRKTLMRELVELESADSRMTDDGKDGGRAADGVEAARERVKLIAAVKSRLEEVDKGLRVLTSQQANLPLQVFQPDDASSVSHSVGVVFEVRGNLDVFISTRDKDGVELGEELEINRPDPTIKGMSECFARVRIVAVTPTSAVARVVASTRVPVDGKNQFPFRKVQVGDTVSRPLPDETILPGDKKAAGEPSALDNE